MGKFLLSMLHIEYEKRKAPITNLSISEANTRLKDLIKKYIKKVYPFDCELRTDETAYEWWSYLDKDQSGDAQPLAVCQKCSYIISKLIIVQPEARCLNFLTCTKLNG
jgi:hypothetical protein